MKKCILYLFSSILIFSLSSCVSSNDEIVFLCISDAGRFELHKGSEDYSLTILSPANELNLLASVCSKGNMVKTSYHRFKVVEHTVVCSNGNTTIELYNYINEEDSPFKEQGVLINGVDEPYICGDGSFSKLNKIDDD